MEKSRQTIHSLSYTAITSEISITVCPEFVDHHDTQATRADVVSVPTRGGAVDRTETTNPEPSACDLQGLDVEDGIVDAATHTSGGGRYEDSEDSFTASSFDSAEVPSDERRGVEEFEDLERMEEDLLELELDDDVEVELTYSEVETDVFRDQRKEEFAFTYNVTIRNESNESVQLLERHWVITSGGALFAEVEGPGVVGVQPVLAPGEEFEYTSWCLIADPVGSMSGGYTFVNEAGDEFLVRIPEFDLVCPRSLH